MAICDNSVLTGQEGSISFKPPGTAVCLPDHTPFDGDCIIVPCDADFRVNDCVVFKEENGAVAPNEISVGTLAGALNGSSLGTITPGSGYQASQTFTDVALAGGSGSGALATATTNASGEVDSVNITAGCSGYQVGDTLTAPLGAMGSGFSVVVDAVQPAAAGAMYYVVAVDGDCVKISTSKNGTPITFAGTSGGTGTEDSPSPAHLSMELCEFLSVCAVREFSLEFSRDELDVTTLPCVDGSVAGCDKLASFRSTQSGYATGSGTMSVYFSCDQETIGNRLLGSSLLRSQNGARVKLYVCTVTDSTGMVDDSSSLYVEAEISITGMSFSVNPDDPTTAELSFSVTQMISAFGMTS
jgi:hypothetical protein